MWRRSLATSSTSLSLCFSFCPFLWSVPFPSRWFGSAFLKIGLLPSHRKLRGPLVSAVCSVDVVLVVQLVEALRSYCFLDCNLRCSNPLLSLVAPSSCRGKGSCFGCCILVFLLEVLVIQWLWFGFPAFLLAYLSLQIDPSLPWFFLNFLSARMLLCDLECLHHRQNSLLSCFG